MGSKRKAPGDTRKKPVRKADVRKEAEGAGSMKPAVKPDRTMVLLAGVLLLALAIRMLPITFNLWNGQVIFSEFDPYYHMRRITYIIANFPFVNSFDSYVNYPYGYGISWPPLFDLIAASLSLIVGLGSPGRSTIELVSASVPVLLGLASVLLLYFIVKDALGKNTALIAAFFMAILPAAAFRASFGFTDHHVLEVAMSLAMYLCFTRALAYAREDKPSLNKLARRPLAYAALAGAAMAGMVFSWDGAPIFIGVIVAYAFVQYAYDAFRRDDTLYLTIAGTISALVALAIVAPFALASQAGQQLTVSAHYLSWFHVIYLGAVALFFIGMGGLSGAFARVKAPWFSAALTRSSHGLLARRQSLRHAQLSRGPEGGFLMGQGTSCNDVRWPPALELRPVFL